MTAIIEAPSALANAEPAGTPPDGEPKEKKIRPGWLAPQPGLWLAGAVLACILLFAFAPGLFTGYDPIAGVPAQKMLPPSAAHIFGTDHIGRDLFTRVVHGTSQSLAGAGLAVLVGFVLGSLLGLAAGSAGGLLEDTVMRIVDVLLSIPALLLSLTVIILLGFGTLNAAIAIGITAVASFARLMRSEVVRIRNSDYVEAAYGSGSRPASVLFRHILPNSMGPVLALAAVQLGSAILAMSTLGFLGYGAQPPTPEWGLLVAEGRNYIATAWWLTTFPGLVVVAVVLSANRISQAFRPER